MHNYVIKSGPFFFFSILVASLISNGDALINLKH